MNSSFARYADLLADAARRVRELMPWDLHDRLAAEPSLIELDVREPAEFAAVRIAGSSGVGARYRRPR